MRGTASAELASRVRALGPWFHDLDLHGVRTAPDHPLGDFLGELWKVVEPAFPADMRGVTVLDIGCNAGFYSLQLHQRGARVTGIDHDARYLEQARFAADVLGADIDYRHADIYEVDRLGGRFDYVLCLGVLYHLRHPLYALEKVASVVRERLVFQSMLRGSGAVRQMPENLPIDERAAFLDPAFPAMYFIEKSYADDPTNWWIPNRAGMEAMLRSAGLRIDRWIPDELYFCSPSGDAAGTEGAE
jgi:tRNA (mo5U34)-methyltransferase